MQFETLKRVQDALARIRAGELDALDCGRHELSDGMYVNVFRYQTQETGVFEAHRRYIDIHYLISGTERIAVADVQALAITQEYDAEKDCLLGTAEGEAYLLRQGEYMVLFPEEAHLPGLLAGAACAVKKAVMKVPV